MSLTNQEAEAILTPFVRKYIVAVAADDFPVVEKFYHPDSVLVEKGKKALYGREGVIGGIREFAAMAGKTIKTDTPNEKFQGTRDYIVYGADFVTESEKAGTIKGKFVQIWKREGDEYLVYHDEFELVQ